MKEGSEMSKLLRSRLKPRIYPISEQAPKRYASRFFQLAAGHAAVGVYLEKIRVVGGVEKQIG